VIEIEKIKNAIRVLPAEDYIRFRQWFSDRDWKLWDKQIKKDSASGKLDFLIDEAMEDKDNGKLKELQMHQTTEGFWKYFENLPQSIQAVAKKISDF
jgi:hypothetical protein